MRVFVAVQIPDEIKKKAEQIGQEIAQEGVVNVKTENMHLTLRFIGDVEQVDEIKRKLEKIGHRKFECELKSVGVFPNENYVKVIWIGAESNNEIEKLATKVHDSLKGYGGEDRFSAHLTIARAKKKLEIREFLAKHNEQIGRFTVTKFELIQSILGGTNGPKYITLASFNLE